MSYILWGIGVLLCYQVLTIYYRVREWRCYKAGLSQRVSNVYASFAFRMLAQRLQW